MSFPLKEHKDFLQCHYLLHEAFVFLAVVAQIVSFCSKIIFKCTSPTLHFSHTSVIASILQVKSKESLSLRCASIQSDDEVFPKSQAEGCDSALFLSLVFFFQEEQQRVVCRYQTPIRYGELSVWSAQRTKQGGDNATHRQARTLIASRIFIVADN